MMATKISKGIEMVRVVTTVAVLFAFALFTMEAAACICYLGAQPYRCGEFGSCNFLILLDPIWAVSDINVDHPAKMLPGYMIGIVLTASVFRGVLNALSRAPAPFDGKEAVCDAALQADAIEAKRCTRLTEVERLIVDLQDERTALLKHTHSITNAAGEDEALFS